MPRDHWEIYLPGRLTQATGHKRSLAKEPYAKLMDAAVGSPGFNCHCQGMPRRSTCSPTASVYQVDLYIIWRPFPFCTGLTKGKASAAPMSCSSFCTQQSADAFYAPCTCRRPLLCFVLAILASLRRPNILAKLIKIQIALLLVQNLPGICNITLHLK